MTQVSQKWGIGRYSPMREMKGHYGQPKLWKHHAVEKQACDNNKWWLWQWAHPYCSEWDCLNTGIRERGGGKRAWYTDIPIDGRGECSLSRCVSSCRPTRCMLYQISIYASPWATCKDHRWDILTKCGIVQGWIMRDPFNLIYFTSATSLATRL